MPARVDRDEPTAEAAPGREGEALGILICENGEAVFHRLPDRGAMTVGRSDACDVVIDHESVSRKHATFHAGAPPTVSDAGSRNGTTVAGSRLADGERRAIAPGAVVELGRVLAVVQSRAQGRAAAKSALGPPSTVGPRTGEAAPIVRDEAMKQIYRLLDTVAASHLAVLVLGETGVGKDVLAEALHARSPQAGRPFLRLNCAAMPEALLEAELFGYERGAFTGAVAAKPGLFEAADGGMVFLDEVGELSLATQAKLLRVLENGEVLRLGSVKPKRIAVRFVSATNRDLTKRVAEGAFRADLFFRINGIAIALPPLRKRPGDIMALAERFLGDTARLAPDAREALLAHEWPGNVRELKNVVERAVLLSRAARGAGVEIRGADVAQSLSGGIGVVAAPPSREALPLRDDLAAVERRRILEALERCGGNQSRAAKLLGIGRRTLIEKLDAYGLPRPRKPVG